MDITNEEIHNRADLIQSECHQAVEAIMKVNKNSSYQDATNVYLFRKLAELEIRLERKPSSGPNN